MSFLNTLKFITHHPLNRKHKISSLLRFMKWQIGSRLVPGEVVFRWVNGSKFLVRTSETGLTGNIYTGLHEFSEMAFLLHFLRREDLFIDVGANVGSYTILACSAVGAKGIAFEPVLTTYARLVDNVRLNHLEGKVKCVNKGIGSGPGHISFTSDSDTTNHVLASGEDNKHSVQVEVTSLDHILIGESPSFIKIDVEGYEGFVLEGAQNILKDQTLHGVLVELNESGLRYGLDESQILEMMFDHQFESYSYDPWKRRLVKLEGKNLNSDNTLFLRDMPFVLERIKNSPKVSIYGNQF